MALLVKVTALTSAQAIGPPIPVRLASPSEPPTLPVRKAKISV